MKRFELKDHIAGAVYGFAVGDSVGATTEFMTKEQIRAPRACGDDPNEKIAKTVFVLCSPRMRG